MGVGGEVAPDTNKIFMEETNMKKIIATVLAMVMALALCTTAFAATTTTLTAKDYKFLDSTTNAEKHTYAEDDTLVFYAEEKSVSTVDGKTTTTITPAYYLYNSTKYVVVDDSCADTKIVKDGKIVAMALETSATVSTSDVVTSTIKGVKDAECGQYEGENDTFYVIDGKTYKADATGTKFALLNGKVVTYGAKTTTAPHDFTKKNTTTDNKGKIVSITCDSCKKSFTVVEAGKVPTNYTGEVDNTTLAGMVILLGTTTATPAGSTTTTTSPKTFDAGIAMYVGMALTSVAGSAVVIGKKKEF